MSATEYVLLAEVFYLRQEDGSRKRYRTGDVVDGLSDEQVQRLLRARAIGEASDVAVVSVPAAQPETAAPATEESHPVSKAADDQLTEEGRPLRVANKKVLVDWLAPRRTDFTRAELNELNKDDLWELIDKTPVTAE